MTIHPKGVPVTLDKPRTLLYDLNAMCLLRERCGINLMDVAGLDITNPLTLRALLWAGFVHEDPALTLEAVGAALTVDRLQEIVESFLRATDQAVTPEIPADPLAVGATAAP